MDFPIIQDLPALLWVINLGCIDLNQWYARCDDVDRPDYLHFDLDPVPGAKFEQVRESALVVREALQSLRMPCYPKTTGSKGMHIYIPIEPRYSYSQARSFAEILARMVASERPDLFTTPRAVASREKGRVYFDYLQISSGKTISAPYVLRAYPGAPVSTPVSPSELPDLRPELWNIGTLPERMQENGDLWADFWMHRQKLEDLIAGA